MGISEKDYFQGIHAVNCFFNVYLIRCSFHMGYMKDSVNTEADDQYGADQACDDESAAVPDKRGMEYVFQYQTAKINDSDYQQNIEESSRENSLPVCLRIRCRLGGFLMRKPVSRAVANIM